MTLQHFQAILALCLFAGVSASALAEANADAFYPGIYGHPYGQWPQGYRQWPQGYGYGQQYGYDGLGNPFYHEYHHQNKRSAEAEAEPEADAYYRQMGYSHGYNNGYYGYGGHGYQSYGYGYPYQYNNYHHFGKRSADPEADYYYSRYYSHGPGQGYYEHGYFPTPYGNFGRYHY